MQDKKKIAVLGECMLELSLTTPLQAARSADAQFAYGGDTLNMAVYMARLGTRVSYITALGDDSISDWLVESWQHEGLDCQHVFRHPDKVPGMYLIELDDKGERSFKYWRQDSPASQIIDNEENAASVFAALNQFPVVFLSGISLAILKPLKREILIEFLETYRQRGGKVAFDCNHRPALWRNVDEARECYRSMYQVCDIALPTFDDEQTVFGYHNASDVLAGIRSFGVREVVLKMGEQGCLYQSAEISGAVPVVPVKALDTTSAGDSFNAAYLSQRLDGSSVENACALANKLASTVVQHRGAIITREAMAELLV